ncbi:MAG TPA: Ig-like domain-containing protein [Acidimicrobiia bacterium]
MIRTTYRALLAVLCAAALAGGMLAQLALTADPASAATPVGSFSVGSTDLTSVSGQSVTFNVAILGGSGTPTGTVTFLDGATPICGGVALGQVSAGQAGAVCETSDLAVGTHTITASYSGDTTYDPDTSTTFQPGISQVVSQASTTTAVSPSANPSAFGSAVTFTATVAPVAPGTGTPTGNVEFQSDSVDIVGCAAKALASGQATCTTSLLPVGAHDITAIYGGDTDFTTSTSPTLTQNVSLASSSTALVSGTNPSTAGDAVLFTATVSSLAGSPTGTVAFKDGSTNITSCGAQPITTGTATCSTSALAPGSHSVSAVYSGDSTFATSTSNTVTQVVNGIATTTTLSPVPSPNPSVFSGPVVISATVASGSGTPTGTVAFKDGGSNISGCSAQPLSSGVATCTTSALTVGAHSLTASYAASGNFAGSDSAIVTQNVNKASTTSAVVSNHPSATWNQPVTFTATIGSVSPATATPSLGTVAFNADGVAIEGCTAKTLTAGVATCTANADPVGTASITAVFSGDANFTTSTSSPITQTVTKATTGTALSADHNPSRSGQSVTFTATVTSTAGTPTGTVTFSRVKSDSSLESLGTSPLTAGVATLTTSTLPVENGHIVAAYNTTTNFLASTINVAHTVSRSLSRTLITASRKNAPAGTPVTYHVVVASDGEGAGTPTGIVALYRARANGSLQWIARGHLRDGATDITVSGLPVGTYKIYAEYRGSTEHRPSQRSMTQTVTA